MARSWALFNVCCSCRCQRFQIPLDLVFVPLLTLGFPKYWSSKDFVSWSSFSCNPLLLYWSHVDVVVGCEERGAFSSIITFQCFCDLFLGAVTFTNVSSVIQVFSLSPCPLQPSLAAVFPIYFFEGLTSVDSVFLFFPWDRMVRGSWSGKNVLPSAGRIRLFVKFFLPICKSRTLL